MGSIMKNRPVISTAIPKRRFQIGDHSASLLGEIASPDPSSYRYILAFIRMGRPEPELYVCAEEVPPANRSGAAIQLRLISDAMSEVLDTDDRWGDLETFSDQGLRLGVQTLGLQSDMIVRLM